MKKLFVWILILAMILSLVSCSGANIPTKEGSADQGTPAESKPVSGEEGTGESRETEPGGDPVADLPDGFSPIDTAVPSEAFPSSVSYETLAGEQVRDASEAKTLLGKLQAEIGFSDPEEYMDALVSSGELFSSYRFTQMIGGLPVEDRGITVVTDEEGNVTDVLGRYLDPAETDTEVRISAQEAARAVREQFKQDDEIQLIGHGCMITTLGEKSQAAWRSLAFVNGEIYQCYVAARDGSILLIQKLFWNERESGNASGQDTDGNPVKFKTEEGENTYWLEDESSRIRIYDLNGKSVKYNICIRPDFRIGARFYPVWENDEWNPEENLGYKITLNGQADPAHDYRLILQDGKYTVTDNGTVLYPDVSVEAVYTKGKDGYYEVLTDDDNVWENARAVSVMDRLQEVYRFWHEVLKRDGYNNSRNPMAVAMNTVMNDGKENASACALEIEPGYYTGLMKITANFSVSFNVLAHEYTHAVIGSYVPLGKGYYYPEAGAINEGLADLFSELAENHVFGSNDWDLGSRNAKDPSVSEKPGPSRYQGENWIFDRVEAPATDEETATNSTYAHRNGQIISHMGYLITTGALKKSAHTEALGPELTAKLFYETFPSLESDTSFSEYAMILYGKAVGMFRKGQLSADQVRCVFRAMEEVGLLPVFSLKTGGVLDLRCLMGKDLSHFTISISSLLIAQYENGQEAFGTAQGEKYHRVATVKNDPDFAPVWPEAWSTDSQGRNRYSVVITNDQTEDESFSFIVMTSERAWPGIGVTAPFLDGRALFYDYLKHHVVPEVGIGDAENLRTELTNKNLNDHDGLLSALVGDLDGDGADEMVTVTVCEQDIAGTIGALVFSKGTCIAANLDLYELEDGKVVHADGPKTIAVMAQNEYGFISVGAAKWNGITYFTGNSSMDDNTTYGPRQFALFHPEAGKLVFDYAAPGGWGQSLPVEDANERLGTRKMDLEHTTFSHSGPSTVEEIARMDFPQESGHQDYVSVTFRDETCLKEILGFPYLSKLYLMEEKLSKIDEQEKLAQDLVAEDIRREEEAANSPAVQTVKAEIEYLSQSSGITLTLLQEKLGDDGSYFAMVVAPDEHKARVSLEANAAGILTDVRVEARYYKQTETWIALKDAVLGSPRLALTAGVVAAFSGTLSRQNDGAESGEYIVNIFNIDNFTIWIRK